MSGRLAVQLGIDGANPGEYALPRKRGASFRIGRSGKDNDIIIPMEMVSEWHAIVKVVGSSGTGSLRVVIDDHSRGGTFGSARG